MVLAMVGDVMLGRGVAELIGKQPPESFLGNTLPLLRRADLVAAGLECAVTTHPLPWTRTPKTFHFKAPPEATAVLQTAGVRLVSLANNHTLDFEETGLLDTVAHLDRAGIAHAGAGRSLAEARRPALVEAGGLCVGMVAFTDNEPEWIAGADAPGINYTEIRPDEATLDLVEEGIRAARTQGADAVILSLHWGPNFRTEPPPHFRRFARAALDRGADIVHGHSAHIFQGIEIHDGKPILYDTGDFLDDYAVDPELRNDQSLIFFADVDRSGVRSLRLVPVRLRYAVVNLAEDRDLDEICERITRLSAELGTRVVRENETLRISYDTPSRGSVTDVIPSAPQTTPAPPERGGNTL